MTWRPDYVTRPQLKNYLRITDNADDDFIDTWITTVSRNVDKYCGRQFGQTAVAEERIYESRWSRFRQAYVADIDDLQDVTGIVVTVAGTAVAAATSTTAGYRLFDRNAAAHGIPYERIEVPTTGELAITVKWGWTAVPAAVPAGVFLQGARLAARRDSPFGLAGSPADGNTVQLWARVDPDFQTSLNPLVRQWWSR